MSLTEGKKKFAVAISIAVTGSETGHHYFESVIADGFYREEAFIVFYNEDEPPTDQKMKVIAIFKKWDYFFEEGCCE